MKASQKVSSALNGVMIRTILGVFVGAMVASSAQAAAPQQMVDQYAGMCVKSVKMPAPYGESDLAGNPKLQDYCKCFGAQFAERAMTATQNVKSAASAAETAKEELAMRNSCRQKFGLPLSK